MANVFFKHGTDLKGTLFTIAASAEKSKSGLTVKYGITACSKGDTFDYKEGRKKAELFLMESPYVYTTQNNEEVSKETIERHMRKFMSGFKRKSVRKFISEKRPKNSIA